MIKKIFSLVVISILTINFSYSFQTSKAKKFAKSITEIELKEHLYIYASDEFEGRDTGEPGQKKAVEYLRNYYKSIGVEPGDLEGDYFQEMTLTMRGRRGQKPKIVETENVIAIIKGSEKPDEYVVITAHLDHVGVDDTGIYNGADDDGSGTVALLEIAEAFKKAADKGKGPKRSIVFLHVTGEEKGLLGSAYYTDNPIYPLENTIVNLNVDMIGRIDPSRREKNRDYIYLIGSDHDSVDLHKLSEQTNAESVNMTLDYRFNDKNDPNRFYYRSDHYNFAKNGIPIIFYFTGTHADYHKTTDTPDKIEYDLLEMRSRLIFYTAWNIANRDKRLVVDPKPEKVAFEISRDDLKKFHGVYESELMPLKFEVYTKSAKLAMNPVGMDEELVLEAISANTFKQEIAGIEVTFEEDTMKLKMQGREIVFKIVPDDDTE
ncbi:MAG: M28 family peptidase [Flavobacteriaceae bacterium]|nr:M28 family peptidase [Flavobacteriaceae bacterium]